MNWIFKLAILMSCQDKSFAKKCQKLICNSIERCRRDACAPGDPVVAGCRRVAVSPSRRVGNKIGRPLDRPNFG